MMTTARLFGIGLFVVLVGCLGTWMAEAKYAIQSAEEMYRQAELVCHVVVGETRETAREDGLRFLATKLQVKKVLKGKMAESAFEVGTRDYLAEVEDPPKLFPAAGAEAIVFLRARTAADDPQKAGWVPSNPNQGILVKGTKAVAHWDSLLADLVKGGLRK